MRVKNFIMKVWAKGWWLIAPRFTMRAGATDLRIVDRDWATRGLANWTCDWKTTLIVDTLRVRPGTFLDVGANIGQTLIDWVSAPVRSSYVGFEPNSTCVRHLNSIIGDNKIRDARVLPVGLSDSNQVLNLYLLDYSSSDSAASMMEDLRPTETYVPVPVPVYRLDDIFDALPTGPIALIKIDVEGAELHALRGMLGLLAKSKPWVLCEVLHRDAAADHATYIARTRELFQLIASAGYEIYRVCQSSDGQTVDDLVAIDGFPDQIYVRPASSTECDYLLVPAGEKVAARAALLASRH